jgi:hypothetical protein
MDIERQNEQISARLQPCVCPDTYRSINSEEHIDTCPALEPWHSEKTTTAHAAEREGE